MPGIFDLPEMPILSEADKEEQRKSINLGRAVIGLSILGLAAAYLMAPEKPQTPANQPQSIQTPAPR